VSSRTGLDAVENRKISEAQALNFAVHPVAHKFEITVSIMFGNIGFIQSSLA
jgi:hypothetical protein